MAAPTDTIILQNYSTPYRHALFEALGALRPGLVVVHSQRPADEGRRWGESEAIHYTMRAARSWRIGPMVAFALPRDLLRGARDKTFVLHDDNPANLSMLLWGVVLRLLGARPKLWVEHVPDDSKSAGKRLYQRLCSWALLAVCDQAIAFSAMSEAYVRGISRTVRVARMVQTVPAAPAAAPVRRGPVRRFGYMGSEQPRKNLALLLDAFAALDGPFELHVAGVTPRAVPDRRVTWWGYVDAEARERFFAGIDMLVLPSRAEPWGLVVNEAMERGCLAMASSACGSRELVAALDPTLVFEPDRAAIARALAQAVQLDADALRARLPAAIAPYSSDAGARRLAEIIAAPAR